MKNFNGVSSAWSGGFISQTGYGDNSSGANLPYDKSAGQSGTTFVVIGNGGQGGVSIPGGHQAIMAGKTIGGTFASIVIDVNTDINGTASNGDYMKVTTIGVGGILDTFLFKK